MSRSRKKYPVYKLKNDGYYKRLCHKRARRLKDIDNGSAYKKTVEQWDICDWIYFAVDDKTYKARIK